MTKLVINVVATITNFKFCKKTTVMYEFNHIGDFLDYIESCVTLGLKVDLVVVEETLARG